jgi:large subunit ribosomal protein L13
MKVINAENLIMGRLASKAAKLALEGETVHIVNSEKAIITGKRVSILKNFYEKISKGDPLHGPAYPRRPERILRRVIRNMVDYKKTRGIEALLRIKTHIGVPEEFKSSKMETFPETNVNKLRKTKYVSLGEVSRWLGAKW